MNYIRIALISCFALLLAACAINRSSPVIEHPARDAEERQPKWEHHQTLVEPLQHWELNGKVAVNSGKQGGTATVIWKQYTNGYDIKFYGILGQGRIRLRSTEKETRLYTAEGPQWIAADAQNLLGEYTGWYLPVDNMFYWIRGLPAPQPAIQSVSVDANGRLQQLEQSAWTITYTEYKLINGIWLPQRINLKHPGNSLHPALTVKWFSKSWKVNFSQ